MTALIHNQHMRERCYIKRPPHADESSAEDIATDVRCSPAIPFEVPADAENLGTLVGMFHMVIEKPVETVKIGYHLFLDEERYGITNVQQFKPGRLWLTMKQAV